MNIYNLPNGVEVNFSEEVRDLIANNFPKSETVVKVVSAYIFAENPTEQGLAVLIDWDNGSSGVTQEAITQIWTDLQTETAS